MEETTTTLSLEVGDGNNTTKQQRMAEPKPKGATFLGNVSEEDMETDEESTLDDNDGDGGDDVPLLYYRRLFGSALARKSPEAAATASPAPLAVHCTCSVLGQVVLNYNTTNQTQEHQVQQHPDPGAVHQNIRSGADAREATAITSTTPQQQQQLQQQRYEGQEIPVKQWQDKPVSIAVLGFEDGSVRLMDAITGTAIVDRTADEQHLHPLYVTEFHMNPRKPIVAVSMDASGTVISAIDEAGNLAIWSVKYSLQYRYNNNQNLAGSQQSTSQGTAATASSNTAPTASLTSTAASTFSKLAFWKTHPVTPKQESVVSPQSTTSNDKASSPMTAEKNPLVPTLTLAEIKTQRWQYSFKEFGVPTCLCLDPAFRHKQKVVVAFGSGKLVVTSRNWMLQTEHTVLPYMGPVTHKDWRGVEALQWRGTLLVFGDCSGVKLYDMATLRPIAHVDRPTGARPSLYSDVAAVVKPHLCLESARTLLVAWGDCLMELRITEQSSSTTSLAAAAAAASSTASTTTSNKPSASNDAPSPVTSPVVRKRHVTCTKAWNLDCVAAGVVPMDVNHIAVLGMIHDDDDDNDQSSKQSSNRQEAEVELQIIDRNNGFVVHADLLALATEPAKKDSTKASLATTSTNAATSAAASHYSLMSSFAVPRMDDAAELREMQGGDPGIVASLVGAGTSAVDFVDSHLRWNLKMVAYDHDDKDDVQNADMDTDSVDSDDYSFIRRPSTPPEATQLTAVPPHILVASSTDVVAARVRTIDDAVSFALQNGKPATALRRALPRVQNLQWYSIHDLVGEYLKSLLRLPKTDQEATVSHTDALKRPPQQLSLRRMKLAAEALPMLLGGNIDMWETWVVELEKIPGALFVVRGFLPVRDPRLPSRVYAMVLRKMLEEVEDMLLKQQSMDATLLRLAREAERHFLNTLVAWGTTKTLEEHINLYEYQCSLDDNFEGMLQATMENLNRRNKQTAVGYLAFSPADREEVPTEIDGTLPRRALVSDAMDSLYKIDDMIVMLGRRIAVAKVVVNDDVVAAAAAANDDLSPFIGSDRMDSRVALESLAKLYMMKGNHDEALKFYLISGALHASSPLEEMEGEALEMVNSDVENQSRNNNRKETASPYAFVLHMIENHHLHQFLLESDFLPDTLNMSPICALIRLVGLPLIGKFLVQHCTAPERKSEETGTSAYVSGSKAWETKGERRGTLPLDLVTDQLSGSPKLFHWYLYLVFTRKPEVYVKFPNTANPPTVVVNLHKKHLDLFLKFAGPNRDSARALEGIEAYRVADRSTPLLSFIKTILPLGTIGPMEVGKKLEIERRGGSSGIFALELAYFIENYGDGSESEAKLILDLYLRGAQSLMLAVSYAQRTKKYSSILWKTLTSHCLPGTTATATFDGTLFGSLLEAAALSGADLAKLVAQIPQGMQVEGLRPRLVAAIADYRLKVRVHRMSSDISNDELILLLRESALRTRRGMRYDAAEDPAYGLEDFLAPQVEEVKKGEGDEEMAKYLSPTLRPRNRPNRYSHSLSIAIR